MLAGRKERVILFFIVVLIFISHSIHAPKQSLCSPSQSTVLSNMPTLNVTWTSLDSHTPSTILPNSSPVLIGDHVVLNVTLSGTEIDVTELLFRCDLEGAMYRYWRVTCEGKSAAFDTYQFWENITVDVTVIGVTPYDHNQSFFLGQMTFCNYFAPILGPVTVTGDDIIHTITWSCSDRNTHDEHFFEVLISADDGTSFQLLMSNITDTTYVWDTSGFIDQSYIVKVRVFDNDPLRNPDAQSTGIYWPGLNSSNVSPTFESSGGAGLGGPPRLPPPITTSPPQATTPTSIPLFPMELFSSSIYFSSLAIIVVGSLLIIKAKLEE